jgi:hypothetical protein
MDINPLYMQQSVVVKFLIVVEDDLHPTPLLDNQSWTTLLPAMYLLLLPPEILEPA